MRYLTASEVLLVHRRVLAQTGGGTGVRSMGVVESAVAQPQATFGGAELYPTLMEKAVALSFALIQGHGFVDGNKRVAHAALARSTKHRTISVPPTGSPVRAPRQA